ncbi:MAG: carbohydrate binding family 9 domain-containing protein, partial [Acidobacteria bacterium]|nr:carbohydrate binding family 9 domain-containing protein [Acidobacteriota bacterium]
MKPNGEMEGQLAKVEDFRQRVPSDGQPSSQRTEAYLGYDAKNLYAVFVCFDREPEKIRARMVNREQLFGVQSAADDIVSIDLDTFHDQRRAYIFTVNPLGIQADSIWTEGQGHDSSFDTLWYSKGKLTAQGYVVWMAIPFKSLRFPATPQQTWGIILNRDIPRNNEETYWPHYSSRIEGRLNQAAPMTGLENISPSRNLQFIPYGVFRSFRALDTRDPLRPRFERDRADADVGLDAKVVLEDALVVDVAVNPDFSQVESDEPQVTVNQRFEVFFPEKRPFFIENASFFQTPINLVFSRRVADPQFGVRLTGKLGPYALGAFLIDDEAPGKSVPENHNLDGDRSLFTIVRVNRDLWRQSTLGFIITDWEFQDSFNRIGGVDGRFKLSENWVASFQGVASSTRCLPSGDRVLSALGLVGVDGCFSFDPDRAPLAGPAYDAEIRRSGRQLNYSLEYNDRSDGFRTAPGFLRRRDIRRIGQKVGYGFRPEGRWLISWGPFFGTEAVFDHQGTRLDLTQDSSITFEFVGQTEIGGLYNWDRERLRPKDFPVLSGNRDFSR